MNIDQSQGHRIFRWLLTLTTCLIAFAAIASDAAAREVYPRVQSLLSSGETILGQPVAYPTGAAAHVSASIVTLKPGEETSWHVHNAPLFGYVIEGELTVDYGPDGKRVYRTGDALLEAIHTPHNGTNTGADLMRILAVGMAEDGLAITTPVK